MEDADAICATAEAPAIVAANALTGTSDCTPDHADDEVDDHLNAI